MKTTAWFIIIVMIGFSLRSQTVISSCTAADSIVKKYRKSADKLAVRRVEYIGHPYKDSIIINKEISNQYLKALLAVYNATTLPARDTVVAFDIVLDYYYPYSLNTFYISSDTNKLWVKNLRHKILPCGNTDIDYLINRYYLKVTNFSPSLNSPFAFISFESDTNYHIQRLVEKFNTLYAQGIGAYSSHGPMADYYHITDSVGSNFIELTYSLGWGLCMIPCSYFRHWVFRVYDDCSVEYRGSYGEALTLALLLE